MTHARLPVVNAPGEPPRSVASADLLALPEGKGDVAKLARRFLPTTAEEMKARGWDAVDVIFVTGDAYIDHPSFAMALLGRLRDATARLRRLESGMKELIDTEFSS